MASLTRVNLASEPPTGSGISHIETATDSKPAIYTINGTKINSITGSGVYIIKSNGKTKKVVIKK